MTPLTTALGTTPAPTPLVDGEGAAVAAATETLLNCFLREADGWRIDGDTLVVPLGDGATALEATVTYHSPTFRHRYELPVRLIADHAPGRPVGLITLLGLLLDELGGGHQVDLVERVVGSVRSVAGFVDRRRFDIDRLWSSAPLTFIESEQALLLGHPLHPTPKSRPDMSPADRRRYAPETQARFPLHWLAASPDVARHRSATGTPAPDLVTAMLRRDPAVDPTRLDQLLAAAGPARQSHARILLPAHPWELAYLRRHADVEALFDSGALVDLGPLGSPVTPTTSVRTVYQDAWPWQLKFSLHVAVTNSVRVTLPKELDRAVEAATFRRSSLGQEAARIAPAFVCVDDPAYLTVDGIDGFSVLLRENRWPAGSTAPADVTSLTSLCQDHPFGGRSRLAAIVRRLDGNGDGEGHRHRHGHADDAGRRWFARFLDVAVVSLVRLYLDAGLCFEAHQQNTLLELGADGLPERCVYRDSQGYFHREAAHDDVCRVLPGHGEASESIFPEALAAERLVYYPFLNLTLGVVNALGAAGCADEDVLLGDLRRCLETQRAMPNRYPPTLLDRLLDDPRWPCKANLRTRLHGLDELVGDIATQSVYVTVPNPLLPT
jgi:siderophore synthetase component